MRRFIALGLGLVAAGAGIAGDCADCAPKGLLGRRAERRAARHATPVTVVEEKQAIIKTESVYRKVGEKVTILPVEAAKKSK